MKYFRWIFTLLLLIVAIGIYAANSQVMKDDYQKLWDKVDSLDKLQQPNAAIQITDEIYKRAKQDENIPQIIKAQLYRIKLSSDFEENYMVKAIDRISNEIKSAKAPEKQLLHSVLGELYLKYYQMNRNKILDRTATLNMDDSDIQTWDVNRIMEEATRQYQLSLKDPSELKKLNIEAFGAILEKEKGSEIYRPTLFDFLAWRAIGFYLNGETDTRVVTSRFVPENKKYFAPADQFVQIELPEKPDNSGTLRALDILQRLLKFHLNDKNPQALVDADLQRLELIHEKAVIADKDDLYFKALEKLRDDYKFSDASASVAFRMARFHHDRAGSYNPLVSDEFRWENQKAVSICEEAIKAFPESAGAQNCGVLLSQIKETVLNLTVEEATVPGQPSVGLLDWKNLNKVYFRLLKMDYDSYNEMTNRARNEDIAADLALQQPIEFWSLELPDDEDYQRHATEFEIPQLAAGFYVLVASDNEAFAGEEYKLAWAGFWSTALSCISQRLDEGGYDLYVIDRESGKPLPGITVNVYKRDYDYRERKYKTEFVSGSATDKSGYLKIEANNSIRGAVYLELENGDDKYVPDRNLYMTVPRDRPDKTTDKTFFFTDRSIYRPGQLVYFKAIILEKTGDDYVIKPGAATKVEFYDANNQQVSSLDLTTNDYGSVNGSFTIPSGLMNGEMRIRNESGNTSIRVEEYKRPKFEVTFEPVKGSYKLNEEIAVTGTAKAYAGNNIDHAKVSYRVERNVFYPWPLRYGYFYPPRESVEIATGETETDADGKFEITFEAIPDLPGGQNVKQSYSYKITADVSDINGETQSGNTSVNVGTEALLLSLDIPEKVNLQKPGDYKISSTNLNGEKLETTVGIQIYKLKQPRGLLKDRYWEQPDIFVIPENEFYDKFPDRVYRDETDPLNREKGEKVLDVSVNTAQDSLLKSDILQSWDQGMYLVEMTATDAFGTEVNHKQSFTLFDPEAKRPPVETYNWFEPLKAKCEPDETAELLIGTTAKNVKLIYETQYKGKTIERKWISLSNEQEIIRIPIKEEYRGNITFNYSFVKNNRIYSGSQVIEVPYTNKKLDLAFETFRSELEPGDREKWTVTIRDRQGDKVAAEMLASMYDASLDAFTGHSWNFDLYQSFNQINAWQPGSDFTSAYSRTYSPDINTPRNYIFQQYDRLNWFGLSAYGKYLMRGAGGAKDVSEYSVTPGVMNNMEAGYADKSESSTAQGAVPPPPGEQQTEKPEPETFQVRRDFKETAFFYPELRTDESGNVVIEFTLPESFTKWKFMGLAYTRDLMTGYLQQEFTAAKKLMIVPNAPRFFREGDTLYFSAKISNLSDQDLSGSATLGFYDAVSMKDVTAEVLKDQEEKSFTVGQDRSQAVNWKIIVPENYGVLTYRVKATAGNFSDGEEKSIPVLPNRMMVTEAMPMPVLGNETKDFTFDKLTSSDKSKTMENYRLTLEFASNPAWYAVQALPVMSDPEYNNAVSVFSAFFANSIAFYLTNQNPEIKKVFENWKTESPESFLSRLEKNQDLKQVLLEQTPWVLDARSEKERKQRIALLFDLNNMQNRLDNSVRLLEKFQKPNGGFCWMNDMRESRYITQLIVLGFGKLNHLGVIDAMGDQRLKRMLTTAVRYLDREVNDDFERLKKRNPDKMEEDHLTATQIQYLYARSFFNHIMINPSHETGWKYFQHQAAKYWNDQNIYLQGMIALALQRSGDDKVPGLILTSLRDRALHDEEMGMYWRGQDGYFWYRAPIETQAMMIEVFDEIASDREAVEEMKIWLLKQKQTRAWGSSRATADAVYALLARGADLLSNDQPVEITVGGQPIEPEQKGQVEAGSGYFQTSWNSSEIKPDMGNVTVTKPGEGIAWGAMYWQYFEDLDKIAQHETGLSVQKQLFVERDTDDGRKIAPVKYGEVLHIGDRIKVRIEIRADRDMDYVHLRDQRAATFEPVDVISGYHYQGGLGYYQTTKDASTDFFFDYLPKGTYVFEYSLVASQEGGFSNGIATLQCMYAPEFVSHSKGVRVEVEE